MSGTNPENMTQVEGLKRMVRGMSETNQRLQVQLREAFKNCGENFTLKTQLQQQKKINRDLSAESDEVKQDLEETRAYNQDLIAENLKLQQKLNPRKNETNMIDFDSTPSSTPSLLGGRSKRRNNKKRSNKKKSNKRSKRISKGVRKNK